MLIDVELWPNLDVLMSESNNTQLERVGKTVLRKQARPSTCTTPGLNNDKRKLKPGHCCWFCLT